MPEENLHVPETGSESAEAAASAKAVRFSTSSLLIERKKSADFTCPRSVETTFGGSLRVYISLVKSQPPTSARISQSHETAFQI